MAAFRWARRRAAMIGLAPVAVLALVGVGLWDRMSERVPPASDKSFTRYKGPSGDPAAGRQVFHIGHSLVGRDMPAMLTQLAGPAHRSHSQLGWGTTLKAHWEPAVEIAGFATENDHPAYRDAATALDSGGYDALVLTEMVEIRDAIRYHDSPDYLRAWIERARLGNPDIHIFLYETWHPLDDPDGWLERIDHDLDRYWLGQVLGRALDGFPDDEAPEVYVIPGGQVLAAAVRRIEGAEGVPGLTRRTDLFATHADGTQDQIHLNDHGAYLIALTHYAMLYARSPVGLPHDLHRADGTPMIPLAPEAAALMQHVVWDVVSERFLAPPTH